MQSLYLIVGSTVYRINQDAGTLLSVERQKLDEIRSRNKQVEEERLEELAFLALFVAAEISGWLWLGMAGIYIGNRLRLISW
jgi:hypothetical protein